MRRARKINPGKPIGGAVALADLKKLTARSVEDASTGCWLWQGYCDDQGYGQIRVGDRVLWVHRYAYGLLKSRRLGGVEVDHDRRKCSHRNCWNPAHLRRSTAAANRIDANRRRAAPPPNCEAPF